MLVAPMFMQVFMQARQDVLNMYHHLAGAGAGRAAAQIEEIGPAALRY